MCPGKLLCPSLSHEQPLNNPLGQLRLERAKPATGQRLARCREPRLHPANPMCCARGQRFTHSTATTPKSSDPCRQEAGTSPEGHNHGLNSKEASRAPAKGIPISNQGICIPREDSGNLNPQSSCWRMQISLHKGHQKGARFSHAALPVPSQRAALTCPRSWWS